MPRFSEPGSGLDALVAGQAVLLRDGIPGLSLRAIAAEARVSPASLVHRFGGKERLIRVVCGHLSRSWTGYLDIRSREGLAALIPGDGEAIDGWVDDGLRRLRGWLAVGELGRTRQDIGELVQSHRDQLRRLVWVVVAEGTGAYTMEDVSQETVDATFALVEGLWEARAVTLEPMSADRARALLDAHLSGLSAEGGRAPG